MGVLDDSDIEKIKNRNIPKRFYDPRKGYDAFQYAVLAALYVGLVLGAYIMISSATTHADNQLLQKEISKNVIQFDSLTKLFVENSDCPTLYNIYSQLQQDERSLPYIKSLVKDEISFRCK